MINRKRIWFLTKFDFVVLIAVCLFVLFFLTTANTLKQCRVEQSLLAQEDLVHIPEGFKLKIDKAYVINLEDSKERLDNVKTAFENVSFNIERFPAIDGLKFKGRYQQIPSQLFPDAQIIDAAKGYYYLYDKKQWEHGLSEGEVGIYLSHYEIWKEIISQRHQISLILEDDAELVEDFEQRLATLIAHAPKGWDVIFLNSRSNYPWGCNCCVAESTDDNRFLKLKTNQCVPGNTGYLISYHGAKRALEKAMPMSLPVDFRFTKILFANSNNPHSTAYSAYPEIVKISGKFSSTVTARGRESNQSQLYISLVNMKYFIREFLSSTFCSE